MTRDIPARVALELARRTARLNRQARALAEAEALGIDLRDPFGPDASPFDVLADCGRRDFGALI